jgi:pimeloyl-ACP methyl ester carboxylesterase
MTTFALVHGAWHGAWCWERLEAALADRGHSPVSMDLPIGEAGATFADYAAAVLDALTNRTDGSDLVLVGHSLGSMVLPLVAEELPEALSVSLCGLVPNPTGPPWEGAPTATGTPSGAVAVDGDGAVRWCDEAAAIATFYGDCTAEDAAWAWARLRPQHLGFLAGAYPLAEVATGRRTAILALDDAVVAIDRARPACLARLGAPPLEIPGGHSPFLSRPAHLADMLVEIAAPT